MALSTRIDIHHHFVPPKFAAVLKTNPSSEWIVPKWSISSSESLMHNLNTSTAILSLTTPSCDIVSTASEQLDIARDANDTAAAERDAQPSRFGFFATIPNPILYPDEALSELARAFDTLHADGITLLTNYCGKYIGHELYRPLWTELSRRSALVFIHPTSPPPPYSPINSILLPPTLDFTFETTKAACDLITSGTITRNPNLKIILSHGGGTLPYTWHRVAQLPKHMHMGNLSFEQFHDQARNFYFDTALTGWAPNVELLIMFAKPGHVLYGSDFPYAPNGCIEDMTGELDGVLVKKDKAVRDGVLFENALALIPRLKEFYAKEGRSKL